MEQVLRHERSTAESMRSPALAPAQPGPWPRVMLAVVSAAVFAFLGAETVARLRFGRPLRERLPILEVEAHPTRGFAMVPGQVHYTYTHRTRTNALGLRGPELASPPTGPRVLLLGDSMVYGQGVSDGETLSSLVGSGLAAEGTPAEVVNGGVRAYGTNQELALLEELGDRIAPDVVVLCWFWNDIDERDALATHDRLAPLGRVAFDTKTRVEGAAWWRWQGVQLLRSSALLMRFHDRRLERRPKLGPAFVDAAFERLGDQLDAFAGWCRARGARPLVAVLPEAAVAGGDGAHPAAALQERALALARAKGVPAVDLLPPLRAHVEATGRLPVIPHDGHYDGEGNAVLARALVEALRPLIGADEPR